jgi:hypothetical protein
LVSIMVLIEFFESAKAGLKNDINKKA